ncbi:MAG: GAF domain-containing protein, partial [Chloroflexi bacterium]|nr:GAF domain-containing protein [Chloroflexota bacterium]
FPIREGILSSAGLVLEADEQKLGVMFVSFRTRHSFEQDECTRIELFAQQAALAIRNARLVADLGENVQNLTALYEVGQALTSGIRLEEPQVLELIQQQASRLMPMDSMYIALYDEGMDTVRFGLAMQHGRRLPNEYFQAGSSSGWAPRSGGQGRTEEIIHTRKPIFHKTKTEAEAWYAQAGRKEYLGQVSSSWIGVPMMVGEKALGVIAAYHPTLDYAYDEADFQVLTILASQAAIALDNARLLKRERRWAERLKALHEVSRELAASVDPGRVSSLILEKAVQLTGAHYGTLQIVDEKAEELVLNLVYPPEVRPTDQSFARIPLGTGITGWAAQHRQPLLVRDVKNNDRYLPFLSDTRSELAVPLFVEGQLVRILNVEHKEVRGLDEQDQELLISFANLAAGVIQNVRQYEALREEQRKTRAAARLTAMNAVAAGLVHRLTNVAGTIPVWVRQTSELLDPSDPKYSRVVHLLDAINKDVDGILATAQAISSSTEATEPLELVDVALLVSSAIKRIAVPAGITICDKCGEDLPKVLVFSGKLIDTLENVIRNGIEAIDGLGSVTIVGRALTEEDHDWLTLSVEDTGRGIAPEDLPKIFDLFYSTKGGMGFGLWGSKALIESLGGKIAVSSEVGKGTTFTVFLPLEKEAQR